MLRSIRENGTDKRVLVIESDSGFVRDIMFNATHGAYCYFDQQTDWACELGEWLLVSDDWTAFLDSFNNEFDKFLNGTMVLKLILVKLLFRMLLFIMYLKRV